MSENNSNTVITVSDLDYSVRASVAETMSIGFVSAFSRLMPTDAEMLQGLSELHVHDNVFELLKKYFSFAGPVDFNISDTELVSVYHAIYD